MPLIAKDIITGERINITKVEKPRLILDKENLVCELCGKPMFIRSGKNCVTHFSHYDKCENDLGKRKNRTPEHDFAEDKIARMVEEQFEGQNVRVELEFPLRPRENERPFLIADVLVMFPMGWRLAHEIQLSDISKDEIKSRTEKYESIGIDVIWWIGEKVGDEAKNWCIEHFGQLFTIEVIRDDTDKVITGKEFQELNS